MMAKWIKKNEDFIGFTRNLAKNKIIISDLLVENTKI